MEKLKEGLGRQMEDLMEKVEEGGLERMEGRLERMEGWMEELVIGETSREKRMSL